MDRRAPIATGSHPPILVLSQSTGETTTNQVIEHLLRMGLPVLRLNGADLDSGGVFSISLDNGRVEIEIEGLRFDPRAVAAVWFRRWLEPQPFQGVDLLTERRPEGHAISQRAAEHLSGELRKLSALLFAELEGAAWLSHPRTASPNKLQVLKAAALAGLDTPATLITTSKERLRHFARRGPLVTKPIGEMESFLLGDTLQGIYTEEVSAELLERLPDRFFPSLFQERLDKAYELRVFFLAGRCHAAAIFSQLDARTAGDFRKYNYRRPNRVVPYRLPAAVEEAITTLMESLDLETGSLDLIKTPDGRMVFLEVNAIGQLGMVSYPCNYHLEREIAERLREKAGLLPG